MMGVGEYVRLRLSRKPTSKPMPTAAQTALWNDLARQLRADSIRCTTAAGSGHPTSGMSAADLMAVLQASYLTYDFSDPTNPNNDHLIFSKGHACPVLYAMYRAADAISEADLLSVRKFGSIYEGHPTPLIPWIDAATGSLGQGIGIATGVAIPAIGGFRGAWSSRSSRPLLPVDLDQFVGDRKSVV